MNKKLFIFLFAVTFLSIADDMAYYTIVKKSKTTGVPILPQGVSGDVTIVPMDSAYHLELTGPSTIQWQRTGPGDEYEVACFFETKYKDTTWLSTKRGNVAYQVGDEPTIVIDSADLKKIKKAIEDMRMPARWSNEVPL